MKKNIFLLILLHFFILSISAQTLKFGIAEEMLQNRTAALDNVIGVINNNYLIVENDFGKALDFNNNIRTNVRKYSVSNLINKGNIYLNPLVSDGMDEDKIIFTDIFLWKNRVVGFYTLKGKSTQKSFPVYARFFDGNLRPISKKSIDIGEFPHNYQSAATFNQGGTLVNGRNKMAVRDEFVFRVSPDSSKLVMIMPAEGKGDFNLKCKVFDQNLSLIKEVSAAIPIQSKQASIVKFLVGNDGKVHLLTRTLKSKSERKESKDDDDYLLEIHSINTGTDNAVQTKPLSVSNKMLLAHSMVLDASGNLNIIAMYRDLSSEKGSGAHGIYAAKFETQSLKMITEDSHEFNEELLKKEVSEKDIKKGKGIMSFPLSEFTVRPDGGIYAMGQSVRTITISRGSTGALNSYYTEYGTTVFCFIDPAGKIRWAKGIDTYETNQETLTSTAGSIHFYRNGNYYVGYSTDNKLKKKEMKRGVSFSGYDDSGVAVTEKFTPYSDDLQDFGLVARSFYRANDNTVMGCMYKGDLRSRKAFEMAIVQMKF